MSGNWKSDPEITAVFWWHQGTASLVLLMEYQWQSQSPVWGCEYKVSASVNVQSGEVTGVQTTRWNEGSPSLDFLLSCFILLFGNHRKGILFFPCLRTRGKCGQLSFCLKGLCFIESYLPHPQGSVESVYFRVFNISQNF